MANLLATVSNCSLNSSLSNLTYKVIFQIFMLLDLNPVMSIIANVPAAVASSVREFPRISTITVLPAYTQIVACRAVRRLTNYTSRGAEVFAYAVFLLFSPSSHPLIFFVSAAPLRRDLLSPSEVQPPDQLTRRCVRSRWMACTFRYMFVKVLISDDFCYQLLTLNCTDGDV